MITRLWDTPVIEVELENHKAISKAIMEAMGKADKGSQGQKFNLFDYFGGDPVLSDFQEQVMNHAADLLDGYVDLPFNLGRSWINMTAPGGYTEPHLHHYVIAAAVYYMQVPPNSGDLFLYDPRGGDRYWNDKLINGNSGRITHQITAKEGKLVLFPGYLLHSTGVNYSPNMRMSLAININEKAQGK
jgi:uncharacterized protein (TIGR02466 family)